jgi:hypothetical protein
MNAPTRRRFLRGLGGTAIALPYLPSLAREARAAAARHPRRFIFVFISNGESIQNWYPQGPQPWKQLDTSVREAPLAGPEAISTVLGTSLAPFKSKLLLLRGLDMTNADGHHPEVPLAAYGFDKKPRRVSIDQLMAYSPSVYPTPPPLGQPRSLHLLIKGWQDGTYVSTTKDGAAVPAEIDVNKSWNNAFGNFIDPMSPGADLETKRKALRLGVMDRVRGDYQKLKAGPRLGAEDRARLDSHLGFLNDLSARLQQTPAAVKGCARPEQPPKLGQGSQTDESTLPTLTKTNIDLLVAAIKCDRTRVATLELCPETDLRTFSFLAGGAIGGHHSLSHDNPGGGTVRANYGRAHAWYADQVAYLLGRLNEVEDPVSGTTYLDNSIVYFGNSCGCSDGDAHEHASFPVLLAGSGGGYLRTGRYVDYRAVTTANGQDQGLRPYYNATNRKPNNRDIIGRPYNSLLISLMQAMGMQPSEWETGGQPGFGYYDDNINGQYNVSDGQKELPWLRG